MASLNWNIRSSGNDIKKWRKWSYFRMGDCSVTGGAWSIRSLNLTGSEPIRVHRGFGLGVSLCTKCGAELVPWLPHQPSSVPAVWRICMSWSPGSASPALPFDWLTQSIKWLLTSPASPDGNRGIGLLFPQTPCSVCWQVPWTLFLRYVSNQSASSCLYSRPGTPSHKHFVYILRSLLPLMPFPIQPSSSN